MLCARLILITDNGRREFSERKEELWFDNLVTRKHGWWLDKIRELDKGTNTVYHIEFNKIYT